MRRNFILTELDVIFNILYIKLCFAVLMNIVFQLLNVWTSKSVV